MTTGERARADALAEGCSAYRFGERVMVKRLWTDSLGRACVDYTQYAYGVRNECSETLDVLRHSPRCASAFCPTRAVPGLRS